MKYKEIVSRAIGDDYTIGQFWTTDLKSIQNHCNHKIRIFSRGPKNVFIECVDCNMLIFSIDKSKTLIPDEEEK